MTTRMKVAMVLVAAVLLCGGVGCVAMSKLITPAQINPRAVAYVVAAGVAGPNDYSGYPNLDKAERLLADVDVAHSKNQLVWQQLMEADKLDYTALKDVVAAAVAQGQSLESALFGPTGVLALVLGGSAGAVLGLLRKRPGDWTAEEVQAAITGKEAEAKDTMIRLSDVVKNIEVLKAHLPEGVWDSTKRFLKMDEATKEAVAKIKATL